MSAEYLVVSTSLRPGSHSRRMAGQIVDDFAAIGADTALVDLRDHPLPLCDGAASYENPYVSPLAEQLRSARVVVVATPVYNYDANSAAKNLVELTGKAWDNKIVGFLCAAGGTSSYMSVLGLANSLMLDFRCLILPRFVYGTKADFPKEGGISGPVLDRIRQLAEMALRVRVG